MALMQGFALFVVWGAQWADASSCAARCPATAAFLESDCDRYSGQQAKLMYGQHAFFQGLFTERSLQFQNCTGLSIGLTPIPFSDIATEMSTDLDPTQGLQSFDAYMVKLVSFQNNAHQLEDLSNYLDEPRPDYIQWFDILNTVRSKLATYQNTIRTLPIDADFVQSMVREDILFAKGLEMPETWEQWAELSEALDGEDLNGDGIPDYGTCVPMRNWARDYPLFNIVASKVQGNGEGIYFNSETFEPLVNTTAYRLALRLLRRIVLTSPFKDNDDCCDWFQTRALFTQGRCALYMDLPGLLKGVDTSVVQRINASTGTMVWQPQRSDGSYWAPVRILSPGSEEILDISSNTMRPCTTQLCPTASRSPRSDKLINRAPFWATGGWALALAAHSQKKAAMWHFLAWMNRPEQSTVDAARAGYCDSWRKSHLASSATEVFESKGWSTAQLSKFRHIIPEATKEGSNAAMDLRLPGGPEYTKAFSTNMQLQFLGKKLCTNCSSGLDFVSIPQAEWLSEDDLLSTLYDEWEKTTQSNGGRFKQLKRYRSSLSLGPLPQTVLCTYFSEEANEEDELACKECEAGSFYDKNSISCKPCQAGYFSPSSGYDHCLSCADGFASSTEGSSACSPCSMGTYSFPAGNASSCLPCPAGHIAPGRSWGSSCQECTVGFFQNQDGTTACEACPKGTYQSFTGQSYCETCATVVLGMTTDLRGAATAEQCGCAPGTYKDDVKQKCMACPAGMACAGFAAVPVAEPGNMIIASEPLEAYRCMPRDVCPGGGPNVCAGGRTHIGCAGCASGEIIRSDECHKCETAEAWPLFAFYAVVFAFLIGGYYIQVTSYQAKLNQLRSIGAMSMLVGSIQIYGVFDQLAVEWPGAFRDILAFFSFFGFNLRPLGTDCVFTTAVARYTHRSLFFVCCLGIIAALSVVSQVLPNRLRWRKGLSLNLVGQFLLLLFTTLVVIAMLPLTCVDHPNGKSSVSKNMDILCWTSDHTAVLVPGIILLLVAIAFYGACAWAAVSAPAMSSNPKHQLLFLSSFKFLFFRFRVDTWYWSVLLLLRSLLISISSAIFPNDAHAQVMWLVFVFTFYLALHMRFWPWKVPLLNLLEAVIMACMALSVVAGSGHMDSRDFNSHLLVALFVIAYGGCGFTFVVSLIAFDQADTVFNLGSKTDTTMLGSTLQLVSKHFVNNSIADVVKTFDMLPVYDLQTMEKMLSIMNDVGLVNDGEKKKGVLRRVSSRRLSTNMSAVCVMQVGDSDHTGDPEVENTVDKKIEIETISTSISAGMMQVRDGDHMCDPEVANEVDVKIEIECKDQA